MASWPKTYRYLAGCDDAAADEALVAAVRQLEGVYLRYAVEVLLQRGQHVGLLALIENYHRLPAELKRMVLAAASDLAPVMRTAIRDIELQTRINCVEIASQMGSESLAYLFDLGLMDAQVRVREAAALMMRRMALNLVGEHPLLRERRQIGRQGDKETRSNDSHGFTRIHAGNNNNSNSISHGLTRINADNNNHNNDSHGFTRIHADNNDNNSHNNKGPAEAGTHTRSGGPSPVNDSMVTHDVTMAPGNDDTAQAEARALNAELAGRLTLRRHQLVEVLLSSALKYEKHLQAEVVEACIWFEPYLGEKLWELVRQKRSRIARLAGELVTHSDEPQTAHFLVQAMAVQELRPMALKAITERRGAQWFQAILRGVEIWHVWPKVRKALGYIKEITYLHLVDEKAWGDLAQSPALPVLIGASNLPSRRKEEVLGRLWRAGSANCRRQVLLEAGCSMNCAPTLLRTALGESHDPQEARMAAHLLRQMGYEALAGDLARRLRTPGDPAAGDLVPLAAEEIFWRLWTQFDLMPEERRVAALGVIRGFAERLKVRLRVHLASASSTCRIRSARMVGMLGLVDELWRDVLAVAEDQNSRVRSAAVRLLGRSDRKEMKDALLAALDDKDGRVQANAIEAIDETDWPGKMDRIVPKLHSEHNRVRANAARALARAGDDKAVEVLSTMLQDSRVEHRMTAVWTINAIGAAPWKETLLDLAEHDPASAVRRFAQLLCRQLHEATSSPDQGVAAVEPTSIKQLAPPVDSPPGPSFRPSGLPQAAGDGAMGQQPAGANAESRP